MSATIVLFRNDLRLCDNPALDAAVRRGAPIVPLFIWSPDDEGAWPPGAASRFWLHQSLRALDRSLRRAGSRLILRRDRSAAALEALIRESGADAVYWGRRYEPAARARDDALESRLRANGIAVETFNSALLFEPWSVLNTKGDPFRVFTPYWKACLASAGPAEPLRAPVRVPAPRVWPRSDTLESFELEPVVDWTAGIREAWDPGEHGARTQLERFLDGVAGYEEGRDRPGAAGTSRLSPHLHFGEISPRSVWHAVCERTTFESRKGTMRGAEKFLRELGWREFAHHVLYHFPHTCDRPLRERFEYFPWSEDRQGLRAWQQGRTGYPIVDAGMRELWHTGWMHNRVRMVVASFLTKHLLISWREGAKWFWDTLVDADLANNTLGWQWTAGCGADAAPYFRIFNPTNQGEKFDADGSYVRKWVPELERAPAEWIHKPWAASAAAREAAGIRIGDTYPPPMVDHAAARERALAAFSSIKG